MCESKVNSIESNNNSITLLPEQQQIYIVLMEESYAVCCTK